ncbi:MAG: CoA transferase [Steroidobacteraceae bacterium]
MNPENTAAGPFADLKVADFAWVVAGPMIGRVLADFGATVVRVESSKRVDTARLMGPYPNGKVDVQRSALFENCNAGKWGLALDLKDERAQHVARDLIAWADVAVESFAPGQMARWGLGYEQLARAHPDLIMVSTSLMGQSGPRSTFAGYGNIGAAVSGFQAVVGRPGALPISPHGPYTDYVGPRFALAALLGALERRARTGQGCHIDVAQAEAGMQFLAPEIVRASVTGEVVQLAANRDPQYAPHGVFRTSGEDRWVAIVVRNDAEWLQLARIIGGDSLSEDARFTTLQQRKAHEDEIERIVTEWTCTRDALEIENRLQAAGIPAHVVASSEDFGADPQLQARHHVVRMPHPHGGESVVESSRFELSETPAHIARCAPTYGRDNDRVLRELLGYGEDRIAQLSEAGVLR